MMVRLLSICLLLCFGCNDRKDISEFKDALGVRSSKVLDAMINDFEQNYLSNKYKGLSMDKCYEKFLLDMEYGTIPARIKASPEIVSLLKSSGFYEQLYAMVDTIWYNEDDETYYARRKFLLHDGSYDTSVQTSFLIRNNEVDVNEEIQRLYEEQERNLASGFWMALRQAAAKSKDIKDYLDIMESMGSVTSFAMASGLIDTNMKYDDYLFKILVVTELVKY